MKPDDRRDTCFAIQPLTDGFEQSLKVASRKAVPEEDGRVQVLGRSRSVDDLRKIGGELLITRDSADEHRMKRRRKKVFLKSTAVTASTPKSTLSGLLRDFSRDFCEETEFERAIHSSPSLRNFLLRVSPFMEPDTRKKALKRILFGGYDQHAPRAARILATIRETWASELLDAAFASTCATIRYAALRGSAGCNASFLVPRLQKAISDEDKFVRNYAQKMLQCYPGVTGGRDARILCRICGNRIHPAAIERHQAQHKKKETAHPDTREQVILDNHRSPLYEREKPDRWEREMTTPNTPTYRRR